MHLLLIVYVTLVIAAESLEVLSICPQMLEKEAVGKKMYLAH